MIGNRLFAGSIITTKTIDTKLTSMISRVVSMENVLSTNNVPDLCLVSRNGMNATCSFPIYMKSKEHIFTSDDLMFDVAPLEVINQIYVFTIHIVKSSRSDKICQIVTNIFEIKKKILELPDLSRIVRKCQEVSGSVRKC